MKLAQEPEDATNTGGEQDEEVKDEEPLGHAGDPIIVSSSIVAGAPLPHDSF